MIAMARLLVFVMALVWGSCAFAGYSYKGICYPTMQAAADALASEKSSVSGSVQVLSSTSIVRSSAYVYCAGNVAEQSVRAMCSPSFSTNVGTATALGGSTAYLTTPAFQLVLYAPTVLCDDSSASLTAADGVTVGWKVGGTWIAVAAILFLALIVKRYT